MNGMDVLCTWIGTLVGVTKNIGQMTLTVVSNLKLGLDPKISQFKTQPLGTGYLFCLHIQENRFKVIKSPLNL